MNKKTGPAGILVSIKPVLTISLAGGFYTTLPAMLQGGLQAGLTGVSFFKEMKHGPRRIQGRTHAIMGVGAASAGTWSAKK